MKKRKIGFFMIIAGLLTILALSWRQLFISFSEGNSFLFGSCLVAIIIGVVLVFKEPSSKNTSCRRSLNPPEGNKN